MKMKNWMSLLVIAGGIAYWGVTSYLDGRLPGAFREREDAGELIRRTNVRIGKLTVLEVSTKDIIYLKYTGGIQWGKIGQIAFGSLAWCSNPILGAYLSFGSQDEYFMDPGNGIIYGHRGVLEYVVDLTQAKVTATAEGKGDDRVTKILIKVPCPEIDPMTKKLNLNGFAVLLRTKLFKDGDSTAVRMEGLAKRGFTNALEKIAEMEENERDARDAAMKALTALYRAALPDAHIDVQFDMPQEKEVL